MSSSRGWMYRRTDNGFVTQEFIEGVEYFLEFAFTQTNLVDMDRIRCPCRKCKNKILLTCDDVGMHLCQRGFVSKYTDWIYHGEAEIYGGPHVEVVGEVRAEQQVEDNTHQYTAFIMDAMGQGVQQEDICFENLNFEESPNQQASKFYTLLQDADEPLYMGAEHSKLSAISRMMNVKAEFNVSNTCHDHYMSALKSVLPKGNKLPENTYQMKKMMKALGLDYKVIDACDNDCILYYKENENMMECPICKHPCFKPKKNVRGR